MLKTRPKLTIAIPTYNRAVKLSKALSKIVSYSNRDDIEILVSDNASIDATKNVVDNYIREGYNIKYFRNSNNLGFDGNFLNCFNKAEGEYIWILSDDDYVMPRAVESILRVLELNPICVHLNVTYIKSEETMEPGNTLYAESNPIFFEDKNKFIEKIGIYCTFISSLVYKLDCVKIINDKERYYGTNILQSHILFQIMRNSGIYVINTFNCLLASGNETVHYDVFRTWITNYSKLFLETGIECGFDADTMDRILYRSLNETVYGFVLKYRGTCSNEKEWDRVTIWKYIERYPELKRKYEKVINCSVKKLKFIEMKEKIKNKIIN